MLVTGLIIFLSLITIRPQDFLDGVQGERLVFYCMGTLLAMWIVSSVPKKLVCTIQDKFVSLFFIAFVVSTMSVGWISYSVSTFIGTFKLALIYFFIVTVIRNTSDLKKVTQALVFLLTIMAFTCVLEHFGIDVTGTGMVWASEKGVWQIKGVGIFDNPNDIAYSIVLVIPFYLSSSMSSNGVLKVCSFVLLLLSLYAVYLTESRGGYLATFSCLACWALSYIENKSLRLMLIPVIFALLLCVFLLKTSGYRQDGSAMGRIDSWGAGMTMLRSHPIIGVGKGQFIEHHDLDSHNSFVRAGAELGLLGLYSFIGILLYSIKSLSRSADAVLGTNIYRIGFLSYLAAFIVGSMFSTRTYDIIFLVAVALTSAMKRIAAAEGKASTKGIAAAPTADSLANASILMNWRVAFLTILCLVVWHLFLINVWHRFT